MKVTFKTITQEIFQLSINEDQTILEVKNAIAKSRGKAACPAERQKLIYRGKILDDTETFDSLDYDGKKFIILVMKAPEKKVEVVEEDTDENSTQEVSTASKALKSGTSVASTASTSSSSSTTSSSSATASSSSSSSHVSTASKASSSCIAYAPLTDENQEKLKNLIGMGYPESQALAALRAAYFNQPRAVEYLINGIPESVLTKSSSSSEPPSETGAVTEEDEENVGLDFLRQNAAFGQIRRMIQAKPDIFAEVMRKIAELNPPLMAIIKQNEKEFLVLINSDDNSYSGATPANSRRQGNRRRVAVVDINEEEQEAINRLKAMGFPEQLVIEAYLACDKNEELAVGYILSRMNETRK